MSPLSSHFFCRQLTEPQPAAPRTPRKCHLSRSDEHLHLIRRFPGTTFDAKAAEFSRLLYRCVRIHCGQQVSDIIALVVIRDWVASCLSNAPILSFESPVLSFCAVEGEDTNPSSQNSFFTLSSTDSSFVSDNLELDLQSAANLLGWEPTDEDL
jgi:hypothetical protein